MSKITLNMDSETGLIEIVSSGGKLSLSQTEAAILYVILRRTLGIRGRFLLWRMRKKLKTVASDSEMGC